ncbi:MAG: rod-binding protein [Armatimonadetes bacterium]|nr:rod-binding protein [Armatimonadota bacterium]
MADIVFAGQSMVGVQGVAGAEARAGLGAAGSGEGREVPTRGPGTRSTVVNRAELNRTAREVDQKTKLELERLREACGEFEGLFLAQILQEMYRSVLKADFLHGGMAEEVFTGQLCMALGRELGKRGGFGIGRLLYEQLAGLVEQKVGPKTEGSEGPVTKPGRGAA